jgi:hypothetical protein
MGKNKSPEPDPTSHNDPGKSPVPSPGSGRTKRSQQFSSTEAIARRQQAKGAPLVDLLKRPSGAARIAVITPTYRRQNGTTPEKLLRVFKFLGEQTYRDFTLYLVGDCYEPSEEFEKLAQRYRQPIVHFNRESHHRRDFRGGMSWRVSGFSAVYAGIKRVIEDGFDYYLHLDDDDVWHPDHVANVIDCFRRFPTVDFIVTKAQYEGESISQGPAFSRLLPREAIPAPGLNNYLLKSCDSVHSSWGLNLKTCAKWLLKVYESQTQLLERIKSGEAPEHQMMPTDYQILRLGRRLQLDRRLNAICLPTVSVEKKR